MSFAIGFNRSQNKNSIFNNLMIRVVKADKMYQSQLTCT